MRDRVCIICYDTFVPATKGTRVCSDMCRLRLWGLPVDVAERDDCFYCGDKATVVQRFEPPQGLEELRPVLRDLKIPLCTDCSYHMPRELGAFSWAERWQLVMKRLEADPAWAAPEWTAKELAKLGYGLKHDIEQQLERQRWLKTRHAYATRRMEAAHFWDSLIRGADWRVLP